MSATAFRRLLYRGGALGAFSSRLLSPSTPCYPSVSDPDCHRAFPIGWNLYRCRTCAARIEPERWWHRLGWKLTRGSYDPFGRSSQNRRPW